MLTITKLVLGMSLTFAAVAALGASGKPVQQQSQESYEAAIQNRSTAPSYVLITVIDDTTGSSRTGCITANFLEGAIHFEYDLPFDESGIKKAMAMLLANTKHEFHFSRRKATGNVSFNHSRADVDEVREKLSKYTNDELRQGFSPYGALHSLYQTGRHAAMRDAIACVLIERGLSPGMGDVTDQLWLAPSKEAK